ncbi:MAG: hypothetical protein QXY94_01765, partial [Archaeoglobaceae archaeon]
KNYAGLRIFEKMAIEIGGGDLHNSFSDCVLIKKPYDGIDRGDSQKKRAVLLRIERSFETRKRSWR